MTEGKSEKKDDVITDDLINAMVSDIDVIRSKCSQADVYKVIELLEPLLEPFRIKLIDEYSAVVAEIEKDKKRLSPAERQNYLTRLLTPLIKLNSLHPSGKNPYLKHDATYPFIEEKIWIDKEINIKELHYDKQKYSIDFEYSKPLNWFDPDAKNIIIWNEYRKHANKKKKKDAEAKKKGIKFRPITPIDEGKTSIRELYEKWLPTLTEDKIKSNDLLDQLLVCFTLKRALNGDGQATGKLYSLFESAAIGIAMKMAKKRRIFGSGININDIKQEAQMCLTFIISGFKPEGIIDLLSRGEKTPLQIEKFYFWYYSDYVPKELNRIMKRPPDRLDRVEIDYLLNPVSPVDDYTSWQNTPERIVKFNSGSFRPGKGTRYIAAWLFGTKRNYMQGRFCQLISEKIDCYLNPWKKGKEIYYDFSGENADEESIRNLKIKKQVENAIIEKWKEQAEEIGDERIEEAINILSRKNIFKRTPQRNVQRNIEIVTLKLKGFSYSEIAKKYDITKRQVINICNKVKSL